MERWNKDLVSYKHVKIDLIGARTMKNLGMSVHKPRYTDDYVTRKIKIEAPKFDGAHDPKAFRDWLVSIGSNLLI